MGGKGSGRKPSIKNLIKRNSKGEVRTPIGTEIYLPNTSGQKPKTPVGNYDLVNKKYVDDVAGIRTATFVVAASDSKDKERADYVCDGTADEVEINQAISDLPAGGGRVLLLEGTYTIADSIDLKEKLILEGQGKSTKITNGANCVLLDCAYGEDYVIVKNLYLYDSILGSLGYGVVMRGDYSKIEEIYIEHMGRDGVGIQGENNLVRGCIVSDVGHYANSYGIEVGSNYKYNIVTQNFVYNISQNSSGGIHVDTNADFTIVSDNTIKNITTIIAGISLSRADGSVVRGNIVTEINAGGIGISRTKKATISQNKIINVGKGSNDTYTGILLKGPTIYSTYNVVSGNNISSDNANKHKYGIREASSDDDYNLIHGNICTDAATTNISSQGVNSVTADNIAP